MALGLTTKQRELLHFVATRSARGLPPSYAELGRLMGVAAPTIGTHLRRLQRKGYLVITRHLSRTLQVTDKGFAAALNCIFIGPGLCSCGATYFGDRCPACAGVFQEKAS